MTIGLLIAAAVLLAVLTLVSYTDRLYTEMGKFLSREFQENIEVFEQRIERRLGVGRDRAALSMAVLTQLTVAAVALLVGYAVFYDSEWTAPEIIQAAVTIILVVIIFNRLLPFILFSRTRGAWLEPFAPLLRVLIYLALPVTVLLGFCQSVAALTGDHTEPEPEHPSEAVDALIEAGQEEGILEESDRELIQSVVEFGDKTVREVVTPRPEIVAVPLSTTLEQFTEMLRQRPYSRVPVYDGTLDNIVGIIFAHDILQVPDTEARTRTVGELMRTEVKFVPESKLVSDLLRDMQKENVHMAIVIDEYGGVAGLVTIEDLVEEIVGEIRDEHESKSDVIHESDSSYIVPGNMDVDRLDDLFGVRPEGHEATTVAGLVSELLGRIPQRGEVVEEDGLRFEILDSTDRRVERMRITPRESAERKEMRA
jgi:CBS domain containing-hemolysin-like protein